MNQRIALFLSAIMTAFILGGVAIASRGVQVLAALNSPESTRVTSLSEEPAAQQPAAAEPASAITVATIEPAANIPATSIVEPTPEYKVSVDQAAAIAMNAAPGTTLSSTAELVNFQGTIAYEVSLNAGKVYVDANTGQVRYNSIATAAVAAVPAVPAGPVGEDQAVQIASAYLQENGNTSEPVGLRLGRSRQFPGMQLFEVTFADETQVYVNADTGDIVLVNESQSRENHEDHESQESEEDHDD